MGKLNNLKQAKKAADAMKHVATCPTCKAHYEAISECYKRSLGK